MSLADLASAATVINSLAVLVSLVYLTLQMRQSERNQRAMLDQGATTRNVEMILFFADPRINALTTRVITGDTEFTAEELSLLHYRLRSSILTAQDIFIQHKAGLVDRVTLDIRDAVLRLVLAQPVYRALWFGARELCTGTAGIRRQADRRSATRQSRRSGAAVQNRPRSCDEDEPGDEGARRYPSARERGPQHRTTRSRHR